MSGLLRLGQMGKVVGLVTSFYPIVARKCQAVLL